MNFKPDSTIGVVGLGYVGLPLPAMSLFRLFPFMLLLTLQLAAGPVEDLKANFQTRCDFVAVDRDQQLKKLDTSYLAALERQVEKTKATGKLDAVIPLVDEVQAVKAAKDPLPELPQGATLELKQMRAKHSEARAKILKSHAETLTSIADKMDAALKYQETELTKAGKIDDAVAAKQMRESLTHSEDIKTARDLLKQGGGGTKGKPALRLRRYGDNLEVLVFPDRSGKVSMESPVQNVREETIDKKELGDTKAKVLGEFVGAKGYTTDSFTAYHQVFDEKELKNLSLVELVAETRYETDRQKGVKLSYQPGAKNPYASLGEVLPPTASKGTYRITTRYFLPKTNRVVSGFLFVQSVAPFVGNKIFEHTGKWISEDATGESSNETSKLLLYLNLPPGKTVADAAGDSIVLGEVKVELLQFSAYLMNNFDPAAAMPENINDPLKQPIYISNGEFFEKR